jgi:hypothetical protein
MIKIGYSDPPRARRIAGYMTWLLLLSGLWMIIDFGIRSRDNPDAKPAETDRPFAQVAGDDHHSPVLSLAFSPDNSQLASSTINGDVWFKNLNTGQRIQFAMCLVLYNLIQVVRGAIAMEVKVPREEISGEKLFQDVERQMIAWSETVTLEETREHFRGEWTALRVKVRLSELVSGVWRDRWRKAPPKKKAAPKKKIRKRTHSSVYRIWEAHQQRLKKEKKHVQLA